MHNLFASSSIPSVRPPALILGSVFLLLVLLIPTAIFAIRPSQKTQQPTLLLEAACPRLSPIPDSEPPDVRYILFFLAGGAGPNQLAAANAYYEDIPDYQSWKAHWISTYPSGSSYHPDQAWADFGYPILGAADSAAAATALFTGHKTSNERISTSPENRRLNSLADKVRLQGRAFGAVTTNYLSDAAVGAWASHNSSRYNGFAIADEALWGDPNTTGTYLSAYYGGGLGPTQPSIDVLIGSGHPNWKGETYVNTDIHNRLVQEDVARLHMRFVERQVGADGGQALLNAAADPNVKRLIGMFGGHEGPFEFQLADGSGASPENPDLKEMTQAALQVLERNSKGFVLLVEGETIDTAGHQNRMSEMLGEVKNFNAAVEAGIQWVEDPDTPADWTNTLLIVTADHETGYLTAGPSSPANQPLGEISPRTLAMEKNLENSTRRASWEDLNSNNRIDSGETVYWSWNSAGHTNTLVPLYLKGAGADLIEQYETGCDPVRGTFLDNTAVFNVMNIVTGPMVTSDDLQPQVYLPLLNR